MKDADSIAVNPLPRIPKRKGDGRSKLITDDIVEIISLLDEQQVSDSLPVYAVLDLRKIPSVRLEDIDVLIWRVNLNTWKTRSYTSNPCCRTLLL